MRNVGHNDGKWLKKGVPAHRQYALTEGEVPRLLVQWYIVPS
ncbi:BZ3500_MvSof-1268-A1-R1_Chr5-1g07661 [Microbotryum saponariae]|uniref:BZ3500_MvSof-1268-A1-R1_Chr5-1g07661 protein n=1 Tax=Microbotryum saponariae TaxID=289078 RepID=A0A2X0KGQ2_9BASI|nr:BZ3500_MvSof-1268-A1-R1_Chr5-1g07661 [Microbotryum saponariae]SDA05533.1 BZ3501_MvSof-1269-A2-R1_Chr5-2g07486 [Microbotryum saponariae]